MLLTDGFGGFGGISKFSRDFMQALDASSIAERVYALPQLIPHPIEEPIPESVVYDSQSCGRQVCLLGPRALVRLARVQARFGNLRALMEQTTKDLSLGVSARRPRSGERR